MKFTLNNRASGLQHRVHYPGAWLRFIIGIMVAHYLVVYGEDETQIQLFHELFYYHALLASFLITILTSELIVFVTRWLDHRISWIDGLQLRCLLQFSLGLIAPLVLVYILIYFYFDGRDAAANYADYMRYDFPIVICFVVLLNAYYLVVYLFQTKLYKKNISNRHHVNIPTRSTVAVIYIQSGVSFAVDFNGEFVGWPNNLEKSLSLLPSEEYFLISRSKIVHIASIVDYFPSKSRTLTLILDDKLCLQQPFIVSQRRIVEFKYWYSAGKVV